MKRNRYIINFSEWILICLTAFCGSYSFTSSNVYSWIQSPAASRFPGISPFLPEIIWSLIVLFGFQSVILRNKGGGSLTWVVVIVSLPSLLSYDSINIFNILGIAFKSASKLNFYMSLALGVLVMIVYLLLSYMSIFKQSRRGLAKRQAGIDDIEQADSKSHRFLLLATAAALATVALLASLSRGLETLFLPWFNRLSWNVVLIGLGCIFILAVYLFWFGSQRRSNS